MKKNFESMRSRGVALKTAIALAAMASAAAANAALPDWATDIGDDLSAAITDTAAMVGPVVALSIATLIIFKLVKRFANKV